MFRTLCLCLSSALLCPVPAPAQSSGPQLEGTLGIGVTSRDGDTGMGAVDATLTVPLSRRIPLSFELGTYMFVLDGKNPHETYAALAWDDRFRLGVVRPAYDAVLPSVFEGLAPFVAYERAEYSRAAATTRAMRATAVPWGVSAAFSQGATDWQVSLGDAAKGGFTAASISAAHRRDGWQVAAALEAVWPRDGDAELNAKIGARFDIATASFGIALLHPGASDRPDALALDATAPLSDRLELRAAGEITGDGKDAYGLGLDYALSHRAGLTVSVTEDRRHQAAHLTLRYAF